MPYTQSISTIWAGGPGESLPAVKTTTSATEINADFSVPANSTDFALDYRINPAKATSFFIISDQNMTVEVNVSTAATTILTLLAGVPMVWTGTGTFTLGSTAVTTLFCTTAVAVIATLNIRALSAL